MQPPLWQPSVELSKQEERIMKRIRKAKLFVFLRQHRHELLDEAFQSQAFGSRPLRAALDSSPLWGAGRVEDTSNLIGHALKKVIRVVADQQGRSIKKATREKSWFLSSIW